MDEIMLGIAKWVKAKLDEDWDQPIVHDLVDALELGPVRDEATDQMGDGASRLSHAVQQFIRKAETGA